MVSFQCHNCGDVVKKPKLDQHRTRCYGGFDCIDCSTTFNSPAEYKGHISCISEAEKYQKGLYKGARMGESAPKNNYPPRPASEPYPGGGSSWGRGVSRGGRGGRGGFSGRGGWGQQHSSRGTGANDTPLGTPNRMSPVTQSTPAPVKEVPVVESSNDSCKGKKRKSMGSEPSKFDASSHKKAKIAEQADVQHVEPASLPLAATQCEAELKKEEKSKKEKKSPSMDDEVGEKEGKKRKKKEAALVDIIKNDSEQAERSGKKEKSKQKESDKEEKKRKKEKRKDQEATAADGEDTQQNSVDLDSKKNKKKGKEDKESVVSKDEPKESSNKKEKRKERDEILAAEDPKQVNGDVDAKELKKKKKKEKKALEDTINTDSISTSGEEAKKKKSKKLKVAASDAVSLIS